MRLKWPYIFLIFAIPLMVVFVLHFWGENRFDVQVFYTDSVERDPGCGETALPYKVRKELISSDSLTLFLDAPEGSEELKLQLLRIRERFNSSPLSIVIIMTDVRNERNGVRSLVVTEDERSRILGCDLLIQDPSDMILVDGKGRIRGYYASGDREEVDRLAIEIDILLTNGEFRSTN